MKGIQTIMEFTNEIYFNKNLIENDTVKISYTGKLFREFSNEVYIVFGYGQNWENTQEQKMNLNDDCFYADINITGKDTFNFCFRNNYSIWDNNNWANYIAPIYPQDSSNKLNNSSNSESSSESTENYEINEEANVESEVENATEESTDTSTSNFQYENDNDTFSELLESLLNDMDAVAEKIDYDKSAYGLQNFEEIESSSDDSLNKLFNEIYSENTNEASFAEVQNINEEDLDNLFDKVFNYEEAEANTSELEELMNNILNSVLESDSINDNLVEELDSAIDNQVNAYEAAMTAEANLPEMEKAEVTENQTVQDISELSSSELVPAVVSTSKIDMFFDASYKFLQNVGVACKKLGALIKLKAQEYGFIKEK